MRVLFLVFEQDFLGIVVEDVAVVVLVTWNIGLMPKVLGQLWAPVILYISHLVQVLDVFWLSHSYRFYSIIFGLRPGLRRKQYFAILLAHLKIVVIVDLVQFLPYYACLLNKLMRQLFHLFSFLLDLLEVELCFWVCAEVHSGHLVFGVLNLNWGVICVVFVPYFLLDRLLVNWFVYIFNMAFVAYALTRTGQPIKLLQLLELHVIFKVWAHLLYKWWFLLLEIGVKRLLHVYSKAGTLSEAVLSRINRQYGFVPYFHEILSTISVYVEESILKVGWLVCHWV